jgi:hypothetical protein
MQSCNQIYERVTEFLIPVAETAQASKPLNY